MQRRNKIMANHLVTRDTMQTLVNNPALRDQVIGRALVVIFKNQTASERMVNTTEVDNGVGFTGADAKSGSITAKYFIKHGTLLEWQVERWMKPGKSGFARITKYWAQLDEAAKAKAAA
jgi:hypothetical protein